MRFDLSADAAAWSGALAMAVMRHLVTWKAWMVLELREVPTGGRAWDLQTAAAAAGCPTGRWQSMASP
ncbi:MAG: hypothetical protein ACRDOE_20655, partial [Streptosporangiaceae bacterium]